MSLTLTTDLILTSVGKRVQNSQAQNLGEIVEVTRNASDSTIEYAILKSRDRFFAIPVSSHLLKITEGGDVILKVDENELVAAHVITQEMCPSPDFDRVPSIFELIGYRRPVVRNESK